MVVGPDLRACAMSVPRGGHAFWDSSEDFFLTFNSRYDAWSEDLWDLPLVDDLYQFSASSLLNPPPILHLPFLPTVLPDKTLPTVTPNGLARDRMSASITIDLWGSFRIHHTQDVSREVFLHDAHVLYMEWAATPLLGTETCDAADPRRIKCIRIRCRVL